MRHVAGDGSRLIDRMIPAKLRATHESRLRAQTLLFGSLGISGFVAIIGAAVVAAGIRDSSLVLTLLTAAVLGLLPYLQYRTGSYRVPAGLITALLVVTMPYYCVNLDAFPVPAVLAFPLVPLIAAFFLGRAVGLASALVLAGAAVALGLTLPLPSQEQLANLSTIYVVMAAAMTLTSAQLAWVYEGARRRAELDMNALNAALEAARQAADAANRSKTEFLRHVSHELRTPLNSILGHGEMLREELAESGQAGLAADVAHISVATEHILALINELLDISRIEAGAIDLRIAAIDLGGVMSEAIEAMRPLAAARHISLTIAATADLPPVSTDGRRLLQVLLNLVNNACKFTERGEVTLGAAAADGDAVHLWVRDTGVGMTPAQLARIFEPFVQVDGSEERRKLGSGLGLAISRRLIELLGGTITVTSEPGRGSEFRVWLPRERGAADVEQGGSGPPKASA